MQHIIDYLRKEIKAHDLKSGEIIFEYETFNPSEDLDARLNQFFEKHNIRCEFTKPTLNEFTKQEAIASIKYGLSTKANYTVIGKEFTEADQDKFIRVFLELFKQPNFYTLEGRLYQTSLDTSDFWESGGAIVTDTKGIGIVWINDLYGKFK